MNIQYSHSGFTLIELMVTISIVGVVMAFALPEYNNSVKNNCLTTTTNTLVSSLQMARSEATKLRQDISVNAKAGDWANGWTVQAGATVLNDITLTCSATTLTNSVADMTLVYQQTGFIDLPAQFDVCDDRGTGTIGRQITINMVGRPATNRGFVCP